VRDCFSDPKVLRSQALRRRAHEAKWKAQGKKGGATSPDSVELLEDEYSRFIETEYRRTFPDTGASGSGKGDAKAAAPSVTEMETRLLGSVELGPDVIRALAQKRAEVARDRILHAAVVEPSRLFQVEEDGLAPASPRLASSSLSRLASPS
jgi:hypothetical protein